MSRFRVYLDTSGEWRWRLRARNGRIIADSAEGYASKRNAIAAAWRARHLALYAVVEVAR